MEKSKGFGLISLLKSKLVRQTGVLSGSQMLVLITSTFTGMVNSRYLGPSGYGVYSFAMTAITFLSIFFGFGIFSAGARLIALASDDSEEREIAGTMIILGAVIALLFSVTVFGSSLIVDRIFHTNVRGLLMSASFITGALPLHQMMVQLYRGSNRIHGMALFVLIPKLWYLGSAVLVVVIWHLNPLIALLLNLSGVVVAASLATYLLHPLFGKALKHLRRVFKETKEYGFSVYLGRIVDTSTYKLDGLFIASFVNTTYVGFYTLASTIVSPMSTLSHSMSTSLFKSFTKAERIHRKVFLVNFFWLVFCGAFLWIAGRFIVVNLFTNKFLPVVPFILPLAIAGLFQGMYTPMHMFLAANRKGKELRMISFSEATFNVLGNFILIKLYGAMGAAIASAIAKGIELILNLYFYRRTVKNKQVGEEN